MTIDNLPEILECGLIGQQLDIGEFLEQAGLSGEVSHDAAVAIVDELGMARCTDCDVWVMSTDDRCRNCFIESAGRGEPRA